MQGQKLSPHQRQLAISLPAGNSVKAESHAVCLTTAKFPKADVNVGAIHWDRVYAFLHTWSNAAT